MFEKVNPCHPDKVADRIAGAMVDLAYQREENPRIAVEVLIGHGYAYIITEGSVTFDHDDVQPIIDRICGKGVIHTLRLLSVPQDEHLAANQQEEIRCGDNGIFKSVPVSNEEQWLANITGTLYNKYPTDGKYIIDGNNVTACQSCCDSHDVELLINVHTETHTNIKVNPLGEWTGGLDVDSGATNRKLGSDMGRGVTGGGLHGKDLSKADVSVNIVCHVIAQNIKETVVATCAIGNNSVLFKNEEGITIDAFPYSKVVEVARTYIMGLGGFERFAEWGLIRPEYSNIKTEKL